MVESLKQRSFDSDCILYFSSPRVWHSPSWYSSESLMDIRSRYPTMYFSSSAKHFFQSISAPVFRSKWSTADYVVDARYLCSEFCGRLRRCKNTSLPDFFNVVTNYVKRENFVFSSLPLNPQQKKVIWKINFKLILWMSVYTYLLNAVESFNHILNNICNIPN